MPDLPTAQLQRLTDARWQGEQALFTTAVAMLTERPALPDDLAGLVARLRDVSADARDAFAERWADAECDGERPDLEPITAELTVERIEDAADAIEALAAENARLSVSEPQCAVVKPLVWAKRHGQYEHLQAEGPLPNRGPFPDYIIGSNEGKTEWYWCNFGEWDNSPLPSAEAAKAAAQADYEARILSAITLRSEAEVRAEAWAAAIEAAASRVVTAEHIIGDLLIRLDKALDPNDGSGLNMHSYGMTPDWFVTAAREACYLRDDILAITPSADISAALKGGEA